uniref:Beta/gamma crystallin 'Greek key' domain-containing protein n=1 Tax=Gadus morhua TaxID=8049 RepID=A0A8C4Z3I2_GADMO
MRTSPEDPPPSPSSHNGNGLQQFPAGNSRLDHSVLFSSYRPPSVDTPPDPLASRSPFRTSSLPDTGSSSYDRVSKPAGNAGGSDAAAPSSYNRFAFLLNSNPNSAPGSGSLTGGEDAYSRISQGPHFNGTPANSGPGNSPQRPTGLPDFPRTHPPSSMLFNNVHVGSHFQVPEPAEPEKPMVPKYRAFPDAYLTKEKEHGKLNPRPGKIFIYDQPGMCGQRIEVRSDVVDATAWDLQETISIRVVRGGWVMYEKPNFKGEKVALDEGDLELTCPFMCPEEEEVVKEVQPESAKQNGVEANGEQNGEQNGSPARKFIIGSLRRSVRDYSVPEISLFPEENAEGKKVTFRDTTEDARIFGFPVKATSIIINAGLWLVYAEPFFQGVPRVLEVGGFSNPAAWGVEQPYVGSLHPLKIGEPRVETIDEPKIILYDKPYFSGKSRTIHGSLKNFMTRTDNQQTAFMYNAGSLKVQGGIWVGFEKEGFRGHQYLLEEGDYQDWRVWGGCNAEMRSVKVIRADLTEPMLVMFEQPEDEEADEENSFEVTEAIPDVATFQYKTTTRSISVLSGAWVAYSHVDFSGNQYILEKGFYNNSADWGSEDNIICSIQPILLAPSEGSKARNEVVLYSQPNFNGNVETFNLNQLVVPDKVLVKSCRTLGGGWVLYEGKDYTGNQCVLSEGEYPNLFSMGCQPNFTVCSLRAIPLIFSMPSISLFSLECLEGKEITTDLEMSDLIAQGFNNHFLSVRVNSGCWVLCEYSHYRGRQFLLEPIEITNWPKFSSLETVGSMYPVQHRRRFFRVKNKEHGSFLCLHGGLEEMKPGRVVVAKEPEHGSDIWFYDDGFIKNKVATTMSLQVMGTVEAGSKVVLWTETRQPLQTWSAPMKGRIPSLTFPDMVLDVKGGKSYDKDYVVILPENEERASQHWQLELL